MNTATNGVARVLDLGDLTPQRQPVTLMIDGEERTVLGFVRGPACPRSVDMGYRSAFRRWQSVPEDDDQDEAWNTFLDEALMVVLKVDFETADKINEQRAMQVLRHLKWTKPPGAAGAADADGPPPRGETTMARPPRSGSKRASPPSSTSESPSSAD